jgi:outer membrane protein assembly factor BamB
MAVLVTASGRAPAQAEPAAALKSTTADLLAAREQLVGRLESRLKEAAARGECRDFLLRFEEGADHERMHLLARQRGGAWAQSYVTVPIWRHESILEKRNIYHRNGAGWIARDKFRFGADLSGLSAAAATLEGRMDAAIGLDRTREERMPPGTPVIFKTGEVFSWLDKWTYLVHERPRYQRYDVRARVQSDAHELQLVFRKGVFNQHDIHLTFRMPDSAWLRPTPWTPTLCAGLHDADLSALTFKDGVLSGTIKMKINPDKWTPKAPVPCEFKVSGRLENGVFWGKYEPVGDAGQKPNDIEGRGGWLVTGSYAARGDLGAYGSEIAGIAFAARTQIAPLLPKIEPTGGSLADLAGAMHAAYRQVRALEMADRQYPLPIEEALRQTESQAPQWTSATEKDIPAYCAALLAQVNAVLRAKDAAFAQGIGRMPDPAFGAFHGSQALAKAGEGATLPADANKAGPQQWAFVPEWEVAGPFDMNDDRDHDWAQLPEIVRGGSEVWAINAAAFPKEQRPKPGEAVLRGWTKVAAEGGKLTPPWLGPSLRSHFRGWPWFARAVVHSPTDQQVWASLAAIAHAKLWVNGAPAWVSDEPAYAYRHAQEAIFRLSLRKGANELLVRCRDDRAESWLRLHLCIQGAPRSAEESTTDLAALEPLPPIATVGPRGDGYGRFAGAVPPLAWDVEKGANVAWKQPLAAKRFGGPVAIGGKLYLSVAPATLVCLDQESGKQLWAGQLDAPPADPKGDAGTDAILADARHVWIHHRRGVAAAFDHAGARQWQTPTGAGSAQIWLVDGKLLVDGSTRVRNEHTHRALALDAATGKELWKREKSGYEYAGLIRVSGKGATVVGLLTDGKVLDPANGQVLLGSLGIDATPNSVETIENDMMFFTALHQKRAVRFVIDRDGQLGCRFAWNNEYAYKESTRPVQALASERWLFTSATVQEDRKGHSPCPLRELNIFDRVTGEPVGRIKPTFWQSEQDNTPPTQAGEFLFVQDGGGGSAGGLATHGQMAVIHLPAEGLPYQICTNRLPFGSGAPAVFDGGRMFIVSASDVWCIGAATSEAKKAQEEKVAAYIVGKLGVFEGDGSVRKLHEPWPHRPDPAKAPMVRLGDEPGIIKWLYAGPVALKKDPETLAALSRLRAEAGASATVGDAKLSFVPLGHQNTVLRCVDSNYHLLEGFGMSVLEEVRDIALGSLVKDKPGESLVLYTVVANSRPRAASVVAPDVDCLMWLGGRPIKSASMVHLAAGYYPLVLCIGADALAKSPNVRVSFQANDEPGAVKLARAAKIGPYEPWLARWKDDPALAKQAGRILQDLAESRALADAHPESRGLRQDGNGAFDGAQPPVPMTKAGNLLWTVPVSGKAITLPVSDGERIYLGIDSALVALSAADGKKLWDLSLAGGEGGALSAPLAHHGRILVAGGGSVLCATPDGKQVWTSKVAPGKAAPILLGAGDLVIIQAAALTGLDASTGRVRWTVELPAAAAPPVLGRIGLAHVIFAAGGLAVRASDGAVLSRGLPTSGSIPLHAAERMLFAAGDDGITAIALPEVAHVGAAFRVAWRKAMAGKPMCQPVARNGRVYALSAKGLEVLHAVTGEREQPEALSPTGQSQLVLTASHLHVLNTGGDHRTLIYATAPKLQKVLEYSLPQPASSPTFAGDRQFILAGESLLCIGGQSPAEPAEVKEPVAYAPPDGFAPAQGAPVAPLADNEVPLGWLVSTPFAGTTEAMASDFLKDIGGAAKAAPGASTAGKYEGQAYSFGPLDKANFWRHAKFTSGYDAILVKEAAGGKDGVNVFFHTVIDVDSPRYVQFELFVWKAEQWPNAAEAALAAWVSGTPIKSGQVALLQKGKHPLMLQAAMGKAGKVYIAPRFVDLTASFEALKARAAKQKAIWEAYQKSGGEPLVLKP